MEKMEKEFEVHMLNEDGIKKAQCIAEIFNDTLVALMAYTVTGREFSIVRTKLEEAAFFAKKSMANIPENQKLIASSEELAQAQRDLLVKGLKVAATFLDKGSFGAALAEAGLNLSSKTVVKALNDLT